MIVEMNDAQRNVDAGSTTPGNAHQVLLSKMLLEPGGNISVSRPQDGRPHKN